MKYKPAADVAELAIVGVWPPPFGGVASGTFRLHGLLNRRGVRHVVYNAVSDSESPPNVISVARYRKLWLLWYALRAREKTIYFMSSRLMVLLIGAFMARWRGKRVLTRLRNSMLPDLIESSPWKARLAGWAMSRMTMVVCVSQFLAESAKKAGVPEDRLFVCPGFLPPDTVVDAKDQVSPVVWDFCADRSPIIAANGKVNWYNGQDLYGLDHLVELAVRLKPDYPNLGIVICFWDHHAKDQAYLDELINLAKEKGVRENLLFNTQPGQFVPLLAESDVFVRPTNTDGDAVSVRESLYLGIPTVASDSVERPEGTMLFRTRDLDGFEACVREALSRHRIEYSVGQERQGFTRENAHRVEAYVNLLCEVAGGPA